MQQSMTRVVFATILALTSVAGTAIAQTRDETPRDSIRMAESASRMKASLSKAIGSAEKHTGGTAIAVRLTQDRQLFMTDANGQLRGDEVKPGRSDGAVRTEPKRRSGDSDPKQSSRPEEPSTQLYAIVTCVIDQARVRDVVVDMSDGSVLGMQSVNAFTEIGRNESADDMYDDGTQFALVRASDLMNASAWNAENERVGDIDELVLDPESNRVIYGVLRRGGFWGFNESRYALPYSELAVPRNGRILLNLNSGDFDDHSGFDDGQWPTQADQEWSTSWSSEAQSMPRATHILKATDLIGTNVQCSGGQNVGQIRDLIVEPRSGRVVYALINTENGRIVVPMTLVQPMGEGRVIKMTHSEVKALPSMDEDTEPDWNNARWNRRIHDNYGVKMDLTAVSAEDARP